MSCTQSAFHISLFQKRNEKSTYAVLFVENRLQNMLSPKRSGNDLFACLPFTIKLLLCNFCLAAVMCAINVGKVQMYGQRTTF